MRCDSWLLGWTRAIYRCRTRRPSESGPGPWEGPGRVRMAPGGKWHQVRHNAGGSGFLGELERKNAQLVTTDAIVTEFCNMLAKVALRTHAAKVVRLLTIRDNVEVVHVTKELFDRAFILYESRADKDWGLTECISFELMKERRITSALTADHHFEQAGFKMLL